MRDSPYAPVPALDAYIDRHWTSLDDFARKVDCSPSHLRNIIAGRKRPSLDLAFRIEAETNGRIRIAAFKATEAAA